MMKDKEWLKKETEKLYKHDEAYLNPDDIVVENYQTVTSILELIDQLDEPEITEEQAWNKIAESYPADVRSLVTSFQNFYYGDLVKNPTISKKETVYYADNELEKLAVFIMKCFPNEPRRIDVSESAADVAIRLLTKFYEPQKNLQVIVKNYDSTVFTTELPEDEAMKLVEGWKGNE